MNILFIYYDPETQEEISEYLYIHKGNGFFARDTEQAIRLLNTEHIDIIVLQINNLRHAAILKYINENYQHVEVLVMASNEYDDIISVFSKGRYKLFRQPKHLAELKDNILNFSHAEL